MLRRFSVCTTVAGGEVFGEGRVSAVHILWPMAGGPFLSQRGGVVCAHGRTGAAARVTFAEEGCRAWHRASCPRDRQSSADLPRFLLVCLVVSSAAAW